MGLQLKNNAISRLAASILAGDTSLSVVTGEGALFPTLAAGDYFPATLIKSTGALEIVKVTARSGDVFTVTRAQEGTTALAFSSGDRIELRMTATEMKSGLLAGGIHDATAKSSPADNDEIGLVDSAASYVLKKFTIANLKALIWTAWGALIAAGTSKATPVDADSFAICDSAASNATKYLSFTNLKSFLKSYFDTLYSQGDPAVMDFRLSLTSGDPTPLGSATGATTIYCTPYKGNKIGLYTGSAWVVRSSAEFSKAIGTLGATGAPYDIFCYDNAGTPTLEFQFWSLANSRSGYSLSYQDGILVKSTDATRRYLGTFNPTSATTTEDSYANRYLYNYYNEVERPVSALESTATWTYTTASWRQANGSASNQVSILTGVRKDNVFIQLRAASANSSGGVNMGASLATSGTSPDANVAYGLVSGGANNVCNHIATYNRIPSALGVTTFKWVEYSAATGTTTWQGATSNSYQSGITGWCKA